jgi:hypothetical protein
LSRIGRGGNLLPAPDRRRLLNGTRPTGFGNHPAAVAKPAGGCRGLVRYDFHVIVKNKITDKILPVKFQRVFPRKIDSKNKTLPFGIHPTGFIKNTLTAACFPQIHPTGSPEWNFHSLPRHNADGTGKNHIFIFPASYT